MLYNFLLLATLESDLDFLFNSRTPISIIFKLFLSALLLQALFGVVKNLWFDINDAIYLSEPEPEEEEFYDPLAEFTKLDDTVIQVIESTKTKFADVAGNEEAKTELKEVVRFLKNPKKFSRLGAGIPKGVLLGGPPGTGKTLLARAIAGESGTPFLKVSGSQFVQLLVGVGASRVRELFEKARSMKPAIIFIDEIDSIARARSGGTSMGGGNDEREQTLNQILTEMDGFTADTGIIVIAATNRIDILDPAIKRPGRFDRQITISNPNIKERLAILKVHARGKRIRRSVSLRIIATRTIGFSGADLANVLNEAAIVATRRKKKAISMDDVNFSIDRVIIGLEGKQLIRVKARQLTAFREMGKAVIATLVSSSEKIQKVTVVPRGRTQGTSWKIPSASQYVSRQIFIQQVIIALAGRAAEELVNGASESTVEVQQDLAQITRIMRTMILRYAMTRLQELKQEAQQRNLYLLGSDVKTEINNIIDNFITNFLTISYIQILETLELFRPGGERIVDELMAFEELSGKSLRSLIKQYISNLNQEDLLYSNRRISMSKSVPKKLKRSVQQVETRFKKLIPEEIKEIEEIEEIKEIKEIKEIEETKQSEEKKEIVIETKEVLI